MQNWINFRDTIINLDDDSIGVNIFSPGSLDSMLVEFCSDWTYISLKSAQLPWLTNVFPSIKSAVVYSIMANNDLPINYTQAEALANRIEIKIMDFIKGLNLSNFTNEWIPINARGYLLNYIKALPEHTIPMKEIKNIINNIEKERFMQKIDFPY